MLNQLHVALIYDYDPRFIAAAYAITWQSDNGGLWVGSTLGRTKFSKHISPKKTLEGVIGCYVVAIPSCVLMHYIGYLFPPLPLNHYIGLGFVLTTFAIAGDLIESFFKRSAGVKVSIYSLNVVRTQES